MTLFDAIPYCTLPPNHHGGETERLAAEVSAPTREGNCRIVLEIIRRNPDHTCNELWNAAYPEERATLKEVQEVRRRATDLKAAGLIRSLGNRKCRVKTTTMQTLRVTS